MENLLTEFNNRALTKSKHRLLSKQKENDELKELSGQLFSVITHAVSMLSGKAKQNDFVINMKGHHFFECSLLIAQISQLIDCETPQQSLNEIKAQAIEDSFYEYACEKHGAFGADGSEEEEWGIDKANQLREQGDRE
jgi:hypothetical protein